MPKIPMYEKKVGPAAGPLSPRANASAFASGGQALARMGQSVQEASQVARELEAGRQRIDLEREKIKTNFELARQESDANDFLRVAKRNAHDKILALGRNPDINTYDKFMAAYDEIEAGALSEVDGLENVNSSLKKKIEGELYSSMGSLRVAGSQAAFGIEQQNKTNNFNDSAENILEKVRIGAVPMGVAIAQYEEEYDVAYRNGLRPSITPEKFEFEIVRGSVGDIVEDESRTVAELELVRAEILDSEGVYAGFEETEQNQLSDMVSSAIQARTETEGAALEQVAEVAIMSLSVATSDEEVAEAQLSLQSSINGLEKIGGDVSQLQITADATANFATVRAGLRFASNEEINALVTAQNKAVKDSINTPDMGSNQELQRLTNEYIARRAEAIAADPASYVVEQTRQLTGKVPSQSEIYNKLSGMGIAGNKITVLTNAQVESFMSEISEAQSPQEIASLSAAMLQTPNSDIRASVGRQLVSSGFNATLQFIASNPNSRMASLLFVSSKSSAVVGDEKPGSSGRAKILSAVRADPTMSSHVRSMGGEVVSGMTNFEVMAAGVYSPAMEDTATQHVMMVANLAQHLAVTQGQVSLTGTIEPSELTPFIEKAVSVLTERYSYKDINGGSLRLPASMETQSDSVKQGLQFSLLSLDDDQIFFESYDYPVGTPEYDAQKATYVSEVKENFRAITQNGDSSALVTDKAGGAVLVRSSSPHATEMYQPLSVGFMDAATTIQRKGRPSLKAVNSEIQSLNRQINSIFGKERRSEEGKAKLKLLKSKLTRLQSQYKQKQDFLVSIGM